MLHMTRFIIYRFIALAGFISSFTGTFYNVYYSAVGLEGAFYLQTKAGGVGQKAIHPLQKYAR